MNKKDSKLNGLVVPVPTPFSESGAVDFGAFLAHLDWLAECGVRNLLLNGTTGEFFSLTHDEQLDLLSAAREVWRGSLVFHIGNPSLSSCLQTVPAAQEAGADFLASLPPFYFSGAPDKGIIDWFTQLSLSTDLPLILYNFPKHTGNPLTLELLKEIPHWGLKDSSGNLSLIPATPHYFVGGDRKISAAYEQGAKGFVSAASNIDPQPYVWMEEEQTSERQAAVNAVHARTSGSFSIARIKKALSERLPGYPPYVRPPLCEEIF